MSKVVCIGESLIDFMPTGAELTFVEKQAVHQAMFALAFPNLAGQVAILES